MKEYWKVVLAINIALLGTTALEDKIPPPATAIFLGLVGKRAQLAEIANYSLTKEDVLAVSKSATALFPFK